MNRVTKSPARKTAIKATKKQPLAKKLTKKATKKSLLQHSQRTFVTTTPSRATKYSHLTVFSPTEQKEDAYVVSVWPPASLLGETTDTFSFTGTMPTKGPGQGEVGERRTSFTIFKPCKNAMQNEKNDKWGWKIRENRGRGELTNQLAGDDYFAGDQGNYPTFPTLEAAISYCNMEGFDFKLEEEPLRRYDNRSYSDNFKWKGPETADV